MFLVPDCRISCKSLFQETIFLFYFPVKLSSFKISSHACQYQGTHLPFHYTLQLTHQTILLEKEDKKMTLCVIYLPMCKLYMFSLVIDAIIHERFSG